MNILHVLSQRPDSTGSGIYLQAMIRECAARGHRSFVVCAMPDIHNENVPSLSAIMTETLFFNSDKLPFPLPGMSDVMPYPSCRFFDLSEDQLNLYEKTFIHSLKKILDHQPIDIIHSNHLWLLSSLIKTTFPKIPLITSCHGSDLRQFRNCKHLRERILRGCRLIDRVLALTEMQRREISDLYTLPQQRITVAGAGFNSEIFYPTRKTRPLIPTLTYCGKLSRAKGVPWLLQALDTVSEEYHFHLVGSGSGDEYQECLNLASHLGNKITIHGQLPPDKVANLLRSSHFFVLPSLFEGLPLVILEALACGCDIVSTDLPGCQEIAAKTDPDLFSFIPLPQRTSTDKLSKESQKKFTRDITSTLFSRIIRAATKKEVVTDDLWDSIKSFSWSNIFSQVEIEYLSLLMSDDHTQ